MSRLQTNCRIHLITESSVYQNLVKNSGDDVNSTVYFTKETLCEDYEGIDRSLYEVDVQQKNSRNSNLSLNQNRVVVFAQPHFVDLERNTAYMTPVLYYNLTQDKDDAHLSYADAEKSELIFKRYAGHDSTSKGSTPTLPYAKSINIRLITSPHYPANDDFAEELIQYFKTKRNLKLGDIICFPTNSPRKISLKYRRRNPVVYIRVVGLDNQDSSAGSYYVDETTGVTQNSIAENAHIPIIMEQVLTDVLVTAVPGLNGLNSYKSKLIDMIRPFLIQRSINDSILISGSQGCGKVSLVHSVASHFNMNFFPIRSLDIMRDQPKATEDLLTDALSYAKSCAPCIIMFQYIEMMAKASDGSDESRKAELFKSSINELLRSGGKDNKPVIVIMSSSKPKDINKQLYSSFIYQQDIKAPTEEQRKIIITDILGKLNYDESVKIDYIVQRTAGLILGDFQALMSIAQVKSSSDKNVKHQISQVHIEAAIDQLQAAHSDAIGAPKIPDVKWDDIGGLEEVKNAIKDTVQLPLQHPDLFADGMSRSGVILYGPPGTGKTMMAKAVATECSLNFMSVKGPELINSYVGQSEENIRQVFERARSAAPCIVFFDELDSLAPSRGNVGDSGGVMDRIVSQLLAELDGMNKANDVFVIGATNRLELIDPALLRPGRFDKHLYLGINEDIPSKLLILKALTRKFTLAEDCSLEKVAKNCKKNMTGADFYALCTDAMLITIKKKIDKLNQGEAVDEKKIEVSYSDFEEAIDKLVPSLSDEDIKGYEEIQKRIAAE